MKKALIIIMAMAFMAGCGATGGITHSVQRGETLWRICKTYDADVHEVSRLNRIEDPTMIRVGQKLLIPGADGAKRARVENAVATTAYSGERPTVTRASVDTGSIKPVKGRFDWPVDGQIVSYYGKKGGDRNDGIDIKAPKGAPVKAAESGVVAHVAEDMRLYGRIIIIEHEDGVFTLYAHNERNLVSMGQAVEKGQVIARVGSSGSAREHKLHFEVRDGRVVKNPLFYLP